jgi:hypothetical protein
MKEDIQWIANRDGNRYTVGIEETKGILMVPRILDIIS